MTAPRTRLLLIGMCLAAINFTVAGVDFAAVAVGIVSPWLWYVAWVPVAVGAGLLIDAARRFIAADRVPTAGPNAERA